MPTTQPRHKQTTRSRADYRMRFAGFQRTYALLSA